MDSSESMSFQKVVLIVAIIALILVLSFIGYMMYYAEQSKPFPHIDNVLQCPDKWTNDGTTKCKNNADSNSGMFSNIGSFIRSDISCHPASDCLAIVGFDNSGTCSNKNWVQGNVSNGLDSNFCYLLGSWGTVEIKNYGTINSLSVKTGGSGYTTHTYNGVLLRKFPSGTEKFSTPISADIRIINGEVVGVSILSGWVASAIGNATLTCDKIHIGNSGSGFSCIVNINADKKSIVITSITGGSGYGREKTYNNIQLSYFSGSILQTYPTADIVVFNGTVTSVSYNSGGSYVDETTILTADSSLIGGGSGFTASVSGSPGSVALTPSDNISYTLKSMAENISWAKKYGITWDGFN